MRLSLIQAAAFSWRCGCRRSATLALRARAPRQAHVPGKPTNKGKPLAPRGSGFALTRLQIPAAACALPALRAFFQFLNGLFGYPTYIYSFRPALEVVRKYELFALLPRPRQDVLVLNIRDKILIQSL